MEINTYLILFDKNELFYIREQKLTTNVYLLIENNLKKIILDWVIQLIFVL